MDEIFICDQRSKVVSAGPFGRGMRMKSHLSALARNNVPLLGCRDEHLRILKLHLSQLHVAGELADVDTQRL